MKTLLITSMLGLAALLSSCQSSSPAPTAAVSCDKCRTVYFKAPASMTPGNKGFVTLQSSSHMACPECENQVIAWVKTGSLTKHVCNSCGGTLNHCKQH